ncbi:MAG: hypothetical protein IPM51_02280 [Sphingobacteriaceae bacterium]|nr:hypothetical protein [Sphingobacteriaceae bacterium]
MKRKVGLAVLSIISLNFFSATLVVEGKYQNKNVFVQNAYSSNGVGFCAQEIKVNGKITTDETNSSAFEIDLASLQLKYGQNVTIEIIHQDGCMPKVLNLEDLKPKPTFEILTLNLNPSGLLKWSTKNEAGSLPYVVEQFKWNKWIPIGEVNGIGTPETHEYSFQVVMHSGENKYRLKQKGMNSITKYSQVVSVRSAINKPSFAIPRHNNGIDFSSETGYEIYDAYGVVVKKGFGKFVKIDNLSKGGYYLCYDNTMTEFKK